LDYLSAAVPDHAPGATAADAAEPGSFVLHNNLAGSSAGKQRPDQLRGYGLVALRTLIPFQTIG
jgi:hypothetical protein